MNQSINQSIKDICAKYINHQFSFEEMQERLFTIGATDLCDDHLSYALSELDNQLESIYFSICQEDIYEHAVKALEKFLFEQL